MIDLNEIEVTPSRFDLDEIRERLADTAYSWVPALFPNGWITPDRKTLRCADLSGRAPRNEGSCAINLTGVYAGCGYDFATGEKAGPIDLIEYATGLTGRALIEEAARIAGVDRPRPAPRPRERKDFSVEIARIRAGCIPLAGTLGEHYLSTRGLNDPACADLLFNPDVNDYATARGYPALVAIVRDAAGNELGGLHRTYLLDDGGGKAPPGKKMIGAIEGGAVQLAPAGASLGVAEGIETALSVTAIFNVPCWATLSREHMIAWQCPANVSHVTIYADAGQPGTEAAEKLAARLRDEGKTVEIKVPMYGDDFNDDLKRGATAAEYPVELVRVDPIETPHSYSELSLIARKLPKPVPIEMMDRFLDDLARANLSKIEQGKLLAELKAMSGLTLGDLRADLSDKRKMLVASDEKKPPWMSQVEVDLYGLPLRNEDNVQVAFLNDPAFAGSVIYDEFAQKIIVRLPVPWDNEGSQYPRQWADGDDTNFAMWLQRRGVNVNPATVGRAVAASIGAMAVHPVRDYLQSLEWDGKPRLEGWTLDYLGADDTPLHRSFGALWLISAVARIMRPGCKADHVLILEGPQGLGKSTALKALTGAEWFTDEISEFGSKDAALQMIGAWVIEIAELDALTRSEVSSVKAFLTRTVDRYRPPFGRHVIDVPRQCVFAGSVNHDTYLRDETGNRRFWPVRCGEIDLQAIERDRDQLWAETFARLSSGAVWWLTDPDLIEAAKQEQDARYQGDAWEDQINDWIFNDGNLRRFEPVNDVSIAEVMENALKLVDRAKWSRAEQMRVGAYLKRNGWERYRVPGGNREWRYRR
jgi:predicted P-loop ATPase